ncbi:MAG: HAMP domain-containing sensor histidine kinase, partial [Bacteroidota bacterium]
MDIYAQKSRWKWWLVIAGIIIVLISARFTIYLTNKLAEEEKKKVELFYSAQSLSMTSEPDADLTLHTSIMRSNTTIPLIIYNYEVDEIDAAANFGEDRDYDFEFLRSELERLQKKDAKYIQVEGFPIRIYYKQSKILTLLQYFPIIQFLLIAAFIAFGYFSFSTARRGEQNRVWAGMAKETAHQLGTPISAMLGWIDHVKITHEEDEDLQEVMHELRNDVGRLELIADRFSKIGSAPELKPSNIYEELEEMRKYMQRRAPRKVNFDFPDPAEVEAKEVQINAHLFAWVVENLMRNALDAMGGKGEISAKVYEDAKYVNIDIKDSGKGIPPSK